MVYSELQKDQNGQTQPVPVHQNPKAPPRTTLVLTQDLNRWELVKPPQVPREQQCALGSVILTFLAICGLVGIYKSGIASQETNILIYAFWGCLCTYVLITVWFLWRRFVTKTTIVVENGNLIVSKSINNRKPYRAFTWSAAKGQMVERIESVRNRERKKRRKKSIDACVKIHGAYSSGGCCGNSRRDSYKLFDMGCLTMTDSERDWVARCLAKRLDVPVVIPTYGGNMNYILEAGDQKEDVSHGDGKV